jgi:hypothetical protein
VQGVPFLTSMMVLVQSESEALFFRVVSVFSVGSACNQLPYLLCYHPYPLLKAPCLGTGSKHGLRRSLDVVISFWGLWASASLLVNGADIGPNPWGRCVETPDIWVSGSSQVGLSPWAFLGVCRALELWVAILDRSSVREGGKEGEGGVISGCLSF